MKHRRHRQILGRTAAHRQQLMRGLAAALIEHGSIVTTHAKAQSLKRFVEPLITTARRPLTVGTRRQLMAALSNRAVSRHLLVVAQAAGSRPGGYVRLTRMPRTRTDAAQMSRVELVSRTPENPGT